MVLLYKLLPKRDIQLQNIFLLAVSSFFYYYGEQEKILLMYFVIALNFFVAKQVYSGTVADGDFKEKTLKQKCLLAVCLVICIGLFWYFKYLYFTFEILGNLTGCMLSAASLPKIALPLGISFYTFHVLSYTLDVYFGRMRVEKNMLNFFAYVLMFPQLVAGPIVRYNDICYQFYNRVVSGAGFVNGIRRFCYGLAKKVLIANTLSVYVDEIFALPPSAMTTADCWLGAIAYSLQIYFDFSGYSDMAIGLAMLFGFHYKENFNYPYIAKSAGEFWHRWHISLSTWLRDYVYIHMGGSKGSAYTTARNVLFVFLCSGLWHGANITFVCWGLLYGVFIVLENMGLKKVLHKVPAFAHLYLVVLAITGWVIFRADTMTYAKEYLQTMYSINGFTLTQELPANVLWAMAAGVLLSCDWRNAYTGIVKRIAIKATGYHGVFNIAKVTSYVVAVMLFVLSTASIISSSHNPFIYFRF